MDNPTKLPIGSISIVVIQRGERIGLRVRDPESAARREFKGLRWFPYDAAWRLQGRQVPFAEARGLRVPNVTEATQELVSPGSVVSRAEGSEHRLDVVQEPEESGFFMLCRDGTAGVFTYEAGRLRYVAKPDAEGRVVIDLNRAFTSPC